MRILRVLGPLLAVLALLAWGATTLLNETARTWFERDVAMRARLAASGARDALATHIAAADRRRLGGVLEEIARDDRIMAAEACSAAGAMLARTKGFPEQFACGAISARIPKEKEQRAAWQGADFSDVLDGGQVHVSALPVSGDDGVLGTVVLVHDMSYVARRESAMRRVTIAVFAVVALLASVLTVLLRRMSWLSWTQELRTLLPHGRAAREDRGSRGPFQPLVADLRQMVAALASEESGVTGGRWSAERLQRTLARSLHGEGVVVVANREPYIHEHAPEGGVKVLHPASGLVTALEPVMRACSGTWIAHGSGSADRETVDRQDRVKVPPGEDIYSLRRVWLSKEEERGYYYGFSNEGLWPLCHIAHARPTFRAEDWRHYQVVNERFADAVCDEV